MNKQTGYKRRNQEAVEYLSRQIELLQWNAQGGYAISENVLRRAIAILNGRQSYQTPSTEEQREATNDHK